MPSFHPSLPLSPPRHEGTTGPEGGRATGTAGVLAALAFAALFLGACGAARAGPETSRSAADDRTTAVAAGNREASDRAAVTATEAFHEDVVGAASTFLASVEALESALARGSLSQAESAELAAQADFDSVRLLDSGNFINAGALDGLGTALAPGEPFGGLHAVERDLWSERSLAAAAADSSGLVPQAQVAVVLLDKETLDPEAIGALAANELSWVDEMAVTGREEVYSHLDDVDIAATVDAARGAFTTVEPLGERVDPTLTRTVAESFAQLTATVSSLGPPTEVVDSSIPSSSTLALAQEVDATASQMAELASTMVSFGTQGTPA